ELETHTDSIPRCGLVGELAVHALLRLRAVRGLLAGVRGKHPVRLDRVVVDARELVGSKVAIRGGEPELVFLDWAAEPWVEVGDVVDVRARRDALLRLQGAGRHVAEEAGLERIAPRPGHHVHQDAAALYFRRKGRV